MNNQIWKGHFCYLDHDSDDKAIEIKVDFEMDLQFDDDSFHGTTVDEETKDLFTKPITVNGFIDDDQISFVVMYPHNYYSDPIEKKIIIDYDNDYPGCEYLGEYNHEEDKYEGQWSLAIDEFKYGTFQHDFTEELVVGNWEMKRIK